VFVINGLILVLGPTVFGQQKFGQQEFTDFIILDTSRAEGIGCAPAAL
jgi:hypothetical protein